MENRTLHTPCLACTHPLEWSCSSQANKGTWLSVECRNKDCFKSRVFFLQGRVVPDTDFFTPPTYEVNQVLLETLLSELKASLVERMSSPRVGREDALFLLGEERVSRLERRGYCIERGAPEEGDLRLGLPWSIPERMLKAMRLNQIKVVRQQLTPLSPSEKEKQRIFLEGELRVAQDEIDKAFWNFTRQKRGKPPSITSPGAYEAKACAEDALHRLKITPDTT